MNGKIVPINLKKSSQPSLFDVLDVEPFVNTKKRAEHGPLLIGLACRFSDPAYESIAVGWARDVWRMALEEQ